MNEPEITDIAWENAEHTSVAFSVGESRTSGVTENNWEWPLVMQAIEDGAPVDEWVPPSEPTPAERRRAAYAAEADEYRDTAKSYQAEAEAWINRGDKDRSAAAADKGDEALEQYLTIKEEIRGRYPDPAPDADPA
jgi:hypothetical protein